MRLRHNRTAAGSAVIAGLALLWLATATAHAAFAASGDLAWQRIYNDPANGSDWFQAAAPAPNGGIYVAGAVFTAHGDILVARYDATGRRRWLHTRNGSADVNDAAFATVADRRGNLIVAGFVNAGVKAAAAVIKYGPGGQLKWARTFDDPASTGEAASIAAIDRAGNVYVAGYANNGTSGYDSDIILIKYSPTGVRRWVRRYTGPGNNTDMPNDIACDAAGNVYVTGSSYFGPAAAYVVTLKYDPAGHRRWVRLAGTGAGIDAGTAIAVTAAGAVYVAGQTTGTASGVDAVVLKYSTRGVLRWSRTRSSSGASFDNYTDIVLTSDRDVVATGTYYGGPANGGDTLLARLSPDGSTRWVRTYNGPDSLDDEGLFVARGPSGAFFVAGQSLGTASSGDTLTLKYSRDGRLRWARRYTSDGLNFDFTHALAVNGGVYVAGDVSPSSGRDAALLKYRP